VENVLKRAGSVCRVCWVPLLLLSLVSTLDGTVLESYALIPGLELFPRVPMLPCSISTNSKRRRSSSWRRRRILLPPLKRIILGLPD
jgi:hypothetical protein